MASSELNIKITALDHASKSLKSIQSGIIRLVGAVVALGAAFRAIAFPAKSAAAFELEMANVAKTTGFTEGQIAGLSDTLVDMSKKMSVSATGLANVAAIAGQLGLGSFGVDAIAEFTKSVAIASVTLGLTTEKTAEFGAQITSIFNLDPQNIEQVFSTLNELSNTSVATGGQIADIVKRIGTVGGATLQQTSALAAFWRDMGVQVEVAGTSTVKVFSNMTAKANEFAETAGVSTTRWLELMEQDAVSALKLVTSNLYAMDRAQRDATAKELFGGGRILSTFTKLIDEAGNGYARLNGHLETARTSYDAGTSSIEEYEKVMNTLSKQTTVMFNAVGALAIEMGDNLTPTILRAVKAFTEFVNSDSGADFFLQVSEGIKGIINGLVDAITYLASWGNGWVQILSAVGVAFKAIIGISIAKWVLGLVNGLTAASAAVAKYATWDALLAKSSANTTKAKAAETKVTAELTKSQIAHAAVSDKVVATYARVVATTKRIVAAKLEQTKAEYALLTAQTQTLPSTAEITAARIRLTETTLAVAAAERANTLALKSSSAAQLEAAKSSAILNSTRKIGALGTRPFANLATSAAKATTAVSLLKAGLSRFAAFITGPWGVVAAGIVIFREQLLKLFGVELKTTADIDVEQQLRIDKRKAQEEFEKAMRTISDIGYSVTAKSKIPLKVPLETSVETDKVAYADQLLKDLYEATSLVDAVDVVSEALNDAASATVGALDFDFKVNLSADAGDANALNVQAISEDLQRATLELDGLLADQSISMSGYIAGVEEHTNALKAEVQLLAQDYIQAVNIFEEGFNTDLAGSTIEELKTLKFNALADSVSGVREVTLETIEAFEDLIENRAHLNSVLADQAAAELQVEKNAKAAANAVGLVAAVRVSNLTLELRQLQKDLEAVDKQKAQTKATDPIDDALVKEGKSLRLEIAELEKKVNEEINRTKVKSTRTILKGLAEQKLATAQVTAETLKNADATDKNGRSLEQINAEQVANLSEMISKRAILNVQIQEFDSYSSSAIDTAKAMDGAWDNIHKTIRSMNKSMEDFGSTIDEIVRKRALSEGQDTFDLGIDKELEEQLDKIAKKYDALVDKAKDQTAGGAGGFSVFSGGKDTVEELEKQRDAAIEAAKAKADGIKLTEEQRLKEAEVTKAVSDQKAAQEKLRSIIEDISATEDAGGFEGADGVNKYRDAMDRLKDAQEEVNAASDTTRASLKDLARTEGLDPSKVVEYKNAIKELDTAGIDLTRSQAALGTALAASTEELVKAERGKLTSVYQGLNTQINAITNGFPALVNAVNKATAEADIAAKGYGKMAGSMQEVITKIQEMQTAGSPFSGLIQPTAEFSNSIKNLGDIFNDVATTPNIEAGIVIKDGAAESIKAQLDAVAETGFGVEAGVVVTGFTDSKGGNSFILDKVEIAPDAELLKTSTSEIIDGQKYFFKADTPVLRKSLEESFKDAFNVKVNITGGTGIENNASGGSISGSGSGTSDSILSWLSNGEYVIRAASVAKFGTSFFDMLNAGALPKFASGGLNGSSGAGAVTASTRDTIDLNFNSNGTTYTLQGERQQAAAIVNMFKNMSRG